MWLPERRSHGSPVTIFSLYMSVYKQVYGDFTQDEKEKSHAVPGHHL